MPRIFGYWASDTFIPHLDIPFHFALPDLQGPLGLTVEPHRQDAMQVSILLARRSGAPLQGFPLNKGNDADFTHQLDRVILPKRWWVFPAGEDGDLDVRQLVKLDPSRERVCYWIPVVERFVLANSSVVSDYVSVGKAVSGRRTFLRYHVILRTSSVPSGSK